jgi:hypothetical protein
MQGSLFDTIQTLCCVFDRVHACAHVQVLASVEAQPFAAPVSEGDAPGYAAAVGRPMDLGTLRENVAARAYAHPAQAYADVRQVRAHASALPHMH